jgi:choline dehydrogenase
MMGNVFDYVVVGAGSAGCAVAARLSESGRYRVLLLEAGKRDRTPWVHIPLGIHRLYANPAFNWMLESEPIPQLNNRTSYQPRGKVLGGTSAINSMVYTRGSPADYDGWRQLGCEGWDWESVLPYFKRAEDQQRGGDTYHGVGGPLKVSDQNPQGPLAEALVEAFVQAGTPRNDDFNGLTQEGVGLYQTTTYKNVRWSSARAYLHSARKRENLVVSPNSHALKIVVDSGRAVAVEYLTSGGSQRRADVRREVIVSCGAYGSPQLLQLSGIGPGSLLQKMGIPVILDLPDVGENLQDHFNTYCAYRCTKPVTLNELYGSLPRQVLAALQYAIMRSGPLAGNGVFAGAFVRSDPRLERPDLQINVMGWTALERNSHGIRPHPFPGFSLSPVHLRPEGRGSVHIKSPNPTVQPQIHFDFLATEYDMQAMIAGMRFVRNVAQQLALRPYVAEEILPGLHVQSDDELAKDIRQRGVSNLHPVGTCRMGQIGRSVVDSRLRVHGIKGIRVADTSIMPLIVAGNTSAPAIMIGEKAADMMLQDAR